MPFVARRIAARHRAGVIVYHDPTPETVRQHLELLSKWHVFVPYDEVVDALRRGRWADIPPKALSVTLDDGHRGNAELIEVFRDWGLTPTIFVCSQIVGTDRPFWWTADDIDREALKRVPNADRLAFLRDARHRPDAQRQALSIEEIQALSSVASLGAHTRTHPILPMCTDAEAADEILGSKREIERMIGGPCRHFAYPNGDYGDREVELVRQAGFLSARTIEAGWINPDTDPFRVPIIPMPDIASATRASAQVSLQPLFGKVRRRKSGGASSRASRQ